MERLSTNGTNKRPRDVLGTVALCGVGVAVGCGLVAGYVWGGALAFKLLVR
jgi:hypothetical protein